MIRCKVQRHCNPFLLPALQLQHYVSFIGISEWPTTVIVWFGYWGLGFYWQRNESGGEHGRM